jgi:asparagine synthase (glutamine-hydrolysing)
VFNHSIHGRSISKMCGILAVLGLGEDASRFRYTALQLMKRIRHRGPDWSGIYTHDNSILCHERLAIVDVVSGAQPLLSDDGVFALAVNGEIYNHEDLRSELEKEFLFKSRSDCEVILHMYRRDQTGSFVHNLRGMFAFVVYDSRTKTYMAARDPIGIIPLYYGHGQDGSVWFSSELKAITDHCLTFDQFPPGCIYDSKITGKDKFVRYYDPNWMTTIPRCDLSLKALKQALISSVQSHLMSEVPFGVLLSGGLDSSLVASIACRLIRASGSGERLRSYAIGIEGSPDLAAAEKAAKFLGTIHHSLKYTIQEGLDAIADVIYHIETYDVTTIRASTPMFLMARMIKAFGVKMVLSGEGADEIFGGYLYFHKAPNSEEFHSETVRKIKALHMYDCLRANKAMSAWGVEARVPFLDKDFLDYAMNLDPTHKMTVDPVSGSKRIEKFILRQAFDPSTDQDDPYEYLPHEILWRQKEQFSDGVGYSWIDSLKEFTEKHVSDAMMETAEFRFPHNTPTTKEAYYYRQVFESHFPSQSAVKTVPGGPSIACSSAAAIAWDASFKNRADPSGRAMAEVHSFGNKT